MVWVWRWQRLAPVIGIATVLLGLCANDAWATTTVTKSFTSPGDYYFMVPAGVTSITVSATGAAGGTDSGGNCTSHSYAGGEGASVTATVAVSPGEPLFVGVGGPGGSGSCNTQAGAGGTGGGGAGGVSTYASGTGGGGASIVGAGSPSPGFFGSLVVAGGGGGAAPYAVGGNAGSPGANGDAMCGPPPVYDASGCGGGAGTVGAGGAAGAGEGLAGDSAAASGSFGLGGWGGGSISSANGGGGGGGGYYGGGGGGAGDPPGGGGGGGSSFTAAGATNVSGPTPTSNPAKVMITYDAPTASPSTKSLSFGALPQGVISAEKDVVITNTGSAPLVVSAVYATGTAQGDYIVGDRCQDPVAVGGTCEIGIRFAPQAAGARSATLKVESNASGSPATVSLSGTGAKASSSTSLSLSKSAVTFGSEQLERFHVTVSPQNVSGVPTGKVTISSGTVALCTVTLSAGKGSCSPSAKALRAGRHTITAAYAGDKNFNSSGNATEMLTVKR
jgi:hypothetical protein